MRIHDKPGRPPKGAVALGPLMAEQQGVSLRTVRRRLRALRLPGTSLVYFIGTGPFVKIGHTLDLHRRLMELRLLCPFPLEVLLAVDGGPAEEAAMHQRFAALHHRGEWFHLRGELAAFLRQG